MHFMRKNTKRTAISFTDFESMLFQWLKESDNTETIGDKGNFGKKAWVFVRHNDRLYHLNADTTHNGVEEYFRVKQEDGNYWFIVTNRNSKLNKVAFGKNRTIIPGLYLYLAT